MMGKVAYVPYAAIVPPVSLIKPVIRVAPAPGQLLVTGATFTMANREISSLPRGRRARVT